MIKESFEKSKEKPKPKIDDRDVWKEFHKSLGKGDTDKILELAVFLMDKGEEEKAQKLLEKAYEVEGQNFREKAEELLEGFKENEK